MSEPLTRDERQARIEELKRWLDEQNDEFRNQGFPPEVQAAWDQNDAELREHEQTLKDLEVRDQRLRELAKDEENLEQAERHTLERGSNGPQLISRMTERQVYDLGSVRVSPFGDQSAPEMISRARRANELAYYPVAENDQERVKGHIDGLLRRGDDDGWQQSELSRRILATGSAAYRRAFAKLMVASLRGIPGAASLTLDEQKAVERAAMNVTTGAQGGFAVPFQLDPTIVPTSNLSVNPFRAIARVVQVSGTNEWRGITVSGGGAQYQAEGTEAIDNAPTLAQPAFVCQRATSFVPVSFELSQDWGAMLAELAQVIQDHKDDLEATKFTLGSGTGEPQGLITGATNIVTGTGGAASFVIGDLYAVEQALPPRFRPRAQWVGNRFAWQKVRQFDTAGGAQLFEYLGRGLNNAVPTPGNLGVAVLGYPANEDSAMDAVLTTGSELLVLGDFRYYVVVDRIGMDIELIPHLFGATNRYPTGQRGVYAFWRNTAGVLHPNAFRVLRTA